MPLLVSVLVAIAVVATLPQAAAAGAAADVTKQQLEHEAASSPQEVPSALAAATDDNNSDDDDTVEVPECLRHFTRDYHPVCASNGRVYANPSIFQYQQCRAEVLGKPALTQQDMAFCGERSEL